jgi:hypothetical protein
MVEKDNFGEPDSSDFDECFWEDYFDLEKQYGGAQYGGEQDRGEQDGGEQDEEEQDGKEINEEDGLIDDYEVSSQSYNKSFFLSQKDDVAYDSKKYTLKNRLNFSKVSFSSFLDFFSFLKKDLSSDLIFSKYADVIFSELKKYSGSNIGDLVLLEDEFSFSSSSNECDFENYPFCFQIFGNPILKLSVSNYVIYKGEFIEGVFNKKKEVSFSDIKKYQFSLDSFIDKKIGGGDREFVEQLLEKKLVFGSVFYDSRFFVLLSTGDKSLKYLVVAKEINFE